MSDHPHIEKNKLLFRPCFLFFLFLLNSSDKCEGLLTRKRIKGNKIEQAILDFALVSDNIASFFTSMVIDEDRKYALTSYLNGKARYTDHFTEIIDFDIKFHKNPW